ncbi:MAG: hypothetical protein H8E15_06210 [Planctomycetes bacterium]|nr:hypothetical protein [Planctomycetota bacterium]
MKNLKCLFLLAIFSFLSSFASGQSQAWYVDVNDSGSIHNGLVLTPFLSLNDVLGGSSSVSLSPGDQIYIAAGDYQDVSSGGGLESWDYEIPAGISLKYWDRWGLLPIDPGFVRFLGSGKNFGFKLLEGIANSPIVVNGWVSGLGGSDKQRFLFSNFLLAGIRLSPDDLEWESGSSVSLDGLKFEDCTIALDFYSLLIEKEMNLQLKRSIIRCPTASSLVNKDQPMIRIVEKESGDNGSLHLLVESVDIRPVDVNHATSAIAIATEDTRGGSVYELRGVFIGSPDGPGGPYFDGAGIEMLYRFETEALFEARNLRIRDCLGNGILAEVKGDNVTVGFQLDSSKIRNCGLLSPPGSPYWSPFYTSSSFEQSGVRIISNEDARWSQISLNGTECILNGHHGLLLRGNGAVEFPRSFPDVDAFKCNFSYNGQAGVGNRSDGVHCSLQNDGINLDIEQSILRTNGTSGLGINVFQIGPLPERHIEVDLANDIFTDNQGIIPSGSSPQEAAPIHYSVENQYAKGWLRASHLTVTANNAQHAIAIYDLSDPSHSSVEMLGDQSFVENSVLRDNGTSSGTIDTSYFPEPGTTRWTKLFKSTYYSDLESTGVTFPGFYATENENFYVDPDFRQYSFIGVDLGVVFPATALSTPPGSSPLIDRGRWPVFNLGGIDCRAYTRPYDHPGFPNYLDLHTNDVGAIEVQSGE